MKVSYTHESIRLTGRWDVSSPVYAETTTTGSYLEFAFEGDMALFHFDVTTNATPRLHLWIEIDGGARVETPVDSYLRVAMPTYGKHVVRIIYKGGSENDRRWYLPLSGKVSFVGAAAEKPLPIAPDNRKTIEFVGDSITEGVLIDVDYYKDFVGGEPVSYHEALNRCYQDDVCATYAWLTAEALNLRPIFMGYGAVGVTRAGQGKVPAAPASYPYNFDGSPITREEPDYIMINHGTNDSKADPEKYVQGYCELLDTIRRLNPTAKLIALAPFCGVHRETLGALIREYNQKNGTDILFIDSCGWIPRDPIHPLRDGHKTVAAHLIELLKHRL